MSDVSKSAPTHYGIDRLIPHKWRFAAFLLTLITLLVGSRHGISLGLLYVLAGIYAAAGVWWCAGQVWDGAAAKARAPIPVWAAFVVVIVEAQLLLAFLKVKSGNGAVIAIVLLYFAIGSLITQLRDAEAHRRLFGTVMVLVAFAMFAVGASWLPEPTHRTLFLGILVVGLLVVLPVGLNVLLAELIYHRAERRSRNQPGRIGAWWLLGAGGALVVAAALAMGFASHAWKPVLWAVVVAAATMFAIASDSQLDIVIVLGLVGIFGAVRPEQVLDTPYQPAQGQSVLVAFGDSYMSGEGAARFFSGTDEGGGDQCRRAPTAWAALAVTPGTTNAPAPGGFDSLAFLACSGAVTTNVEANGVAQPGEKLTQTNQYATLQSTSGQGPFTPKLAVVSLGGNDAGFSTIGEMCLAPGDCSEELKQFTADLPSVEQNLETAYGDIRAALGPQVPVVAVPYPDPIGAPRPRCGELALTEHERSSIRQFLSDLDGEVKYAANQAGFSYLDGMQDAVVGHQLCDAHPGINFVHLYSLSGAGSQRFNPANWAHDSLHPNELGHELMLKTFTDWLASNPNPPAHVKLDPTITQPVVSDPVTCTIADCKQQANQWAIQQVVDRIWPYGLLPLSLLIGFGLVWAELFGWWRRRAVAATD